MQANNRSIRGEFWRPFWEVAIIRNKSVFREESTMPSFQRVPKQLRDDKKLHPVSKLAMQRAGQSELDEELIRQATENPGVENMAPASVVQLQRVIGNRAVSQLVKEHKPSSSAIQRNPVKDRL